MCLYHTLSVKLTTIRLLCIPDRLGRWGWLLPDGLRECEVVVGVIGFQFDLQPTPFHFWRLVRGPDCLQQQQSNNVLSYVSAIEHLLFIYQRRTPIYKLLKSSDIR